MIRLNERKKPKSQSYWCRLYETTHRLSLLGLFRPKLHVYAVPSKEERAKTSERVRCDDRNRGLSVYGTSVNRSRRSRVFQVALYISAPCQMFKRAYFTIHKVADKEFGKKYGGLTKDYYYYY